MAGPVFDQVLIGGRWVPAAGGTYPVVNPATEEIAGHAPACSVAQAEAAASAARDAFERGPWRTMSGGERAALLRTAAERFQGEMDGLVELTIAETGERSAPSPRRSRSAPSRAGCCAPPSWPPRHSSKACRRARPAAPSRPVL